MDDNRDVKSLGTDPAYIAPDGSEIRLLAALSSCSMAHFRLPAGEVSAAVVHQTVDELWYVVAGEGEMWLEDDRTGERIVECTSPSPATTV